MKNIFRNTGKNCKKVCALTHTCAGARLRQQPFSLCALTHTCVPVFRIYQNRNKKARHGWIRDKISFMHTDAWLFYTMKKFTFYHIEKSGKTRYRILFHNREVAWKNTIYHVDFNLFDILNKCSILLNKRFLTRRKETGGEANDRKG